MTRPTPDPSIFAAEAPGVIALGIAVATAFASWHVAGHLRPDAEPARLEASPPHVADEIVTPSDAAVRVASAESDAPPLDPRARTFNVLLITVDTLRFDLGFMGYPRPVSPNIDALAARSLVYERAYAMASYTPKSLGPLFIGRYASETFRDGEHYTTFYPANVFVAERVRAAGGRTLAGMTHHYFRWQTGFAQGFDVWDLSALPPEHHDNDPTVTSTALTDAALRLLGSPRAAEIPVAAPAPSSADAGARRVEDEDARFFAWFHYLDPHSPYVRHEGAPKFGDDDAGIPSARSPYDGEVWFTDKEIGRLLDHVAAQPWAADTAILFTADHGESFGERGHLKHGRELWETLVRVPLLLCVPGLAPRRIAVKRSHIDVVPTILELMGIDAEDGALRGKSLLDDALTDRPEERDVYMDMPEGPFNEQRRAVITGPSPGLKLIEFGGGRKALFDLDADPLEAKDILSDRERRREAEDAMARVRARLELRSPTR